MDFFESQDVARRNTGRLIVYFVLAVLLMNVALYAVVVSVLSTAKSNGGEIDWFQLDIFAIVTVINGVIIAIGSGLKSLELRAGGSAVAEMLGGRRIQPNTTDPSERQLVNVVEEMAIASGTPVPPVYLLDQEEGINAFAAGFTPGDAVIGMNRGTTECLTRDELQGVVAHEFSHILNGDMRLNLRLVGILHGIQLLSLIGYFVFRSMGSSSRRSSRSDSKGGDGGQAAIMIIGLAAYIIGYIGLFFGRLIKSAVSRQREYLADASAVQFTRYPDGIGGALKKIGGIVKGSRLDTPAAEVASHMFFANAMRFRANGPFATHPPLAERISRIDPQFDGKFPRVARLTDARAEPVVAEAVKHPSAGRPPMPPIPLPIPGLGDRAAGVQPGPEQAAGVPLAAGHGALSAAVVLASIGQPTTEHVDRASHLMQSVPTFIMESARDPYSARAIVFATLLEKPAREGEDDIRAAQLTMIRKAAGEEMAFVTEQLNADLGQLDPATRLPLIQIVQGTLHDLAPAQYHDFRKMVQALIAADRRVSLLEFVMQRLILLRLDRHFQNRKPPRVAYHSTGAVKGEAITLLSMLAHAGHTDEDLSRKAFDEAMNVFLKGAVSESILPPQECRVPQLHEALDKFERATPAVKQLLLQAAAASIATDGEISIAEAELMRAIADSLDCPIPVPA